MPLPITLDSILRDPLFVDPFERFNSLGFFFKYYELIFDCICQFSGQEKAERSEPAAAEDDVHAGADPAAGSRVPVGRIRFADETLRAGVGAGIERNSNQNLVPESSGQRQAHREGPHRPPVQVRKYIALRLDSMIVA